MQHIKATTLEQIWADRQGAPEGVGRLLDAIAQHLFEPAFGGEALKRSCSPTPETLWAFWQRLGCDPATYLEKRRLETACRAVRETDVRVADLAHAFGFEDPGNFSRWFKSRTGLAPNNLRALGGPVSPKVSPEPETTQATGNQIVISPALARQALVGMLEAEDLRPLLGFLRGLYPEGQDYPEGEV